MQLSNQSDSSSSQKVVYGSLTSTVHKNWNLSIYARTQKELRLEQTKLPKEQQEQRLIEVFNNRPPVLDEEINPKNKKIVSYEHQHVKVKSQLGVINPEHVYVDPRVSVVEKKQKEEDWFAKRSEKQQPSKQLARPQSAIVTATSKFETTQNFEIQSKKIEIKPPPLLEMEKPFMQEHLVSPYIYIQTVIKKNSEDVHIKHPDIWDKSTNKKSWRNNKQQETKKKGKEIPKGKQSKQEREQLKKEKEERQQFYLQNLKMREFLFKFFKTINKLLKEKHFSKVIYKGDTENYDLGVLFKLWAQHKGINTDPKINPNQYLTKEQFVDFILDIGLDPERKGEAERFFDYCHEMVAAGNKEGKTVNEKGVIVPKWWKVFSEENKELKEGLQMNKDQDELKNFI